MPKKEVEELYKQIQDILFKLIPQKWESLYLYASVVNGRGEMYFYYFPKKTIFKPRPISCYQIASKFGINEEQYNRALAELYNKIKILNMLSIPKWSNLTISIVNCLFTIEYNYSDLLHSKYTDKQRHIYWEYKYLKIPIASMSKEDQIMVNNYWQEQNSKTSVYTEGIYIQGKQINDSKIMIQKQEKVKQSTIEEDRIRNQILKC